MIRRDMAKRLGGVGILLGPVLWVAAAGCSPPNGNVPYDAPPDVLAPRNPVAGGGSAQGSQCGQPEGRLYDDLTFSGTEATVQHAIESPNQVDVYELGRLEEGTSLRIEVDALSGDLDPEVGVFDDEGNLAGLNDDEDLENKLLDSRLEMSVRHQDTYYLVVAASRFFAPSPCASTGGYVLKVEVTPDRTPEPRGQVVFLDFDGGDVSSIVGVTSATVAAFDAVDLGFPASLTEQFRNDIVRLMEADYAGMNVTFVTLSEPPPEPPFTTVIFGGAEDNLLGISDAIDPFNENLANRVVVFTQNFTNVSNDPAEAATAVANVASHELAHAMGLVHVENDTVIMDRTTPSQFLVLDQSFGRAPLSEFLTGFQDAALLLAEWLGVL